MPYETDNALKSKLDSNQLDRERMCLAVLALDRRFTEIKPRHPHGGPDGGRDIEAVYRKDEVAYGAVGFVNGANDSNEQIKTIQKKFREDVDRAIEAKSDLTAFVFFTNVRLTAGQKEGLHQYARSVGISFLEVFDRELMRVSLDSVDGFAARFQYLGIPLSNPEQATFFSRWGDDINSVISTGLGNVERKIDRLIFLHESQEEVNDFVFVLALDKEYSAEEIGHFRSYCIITLDLVCDDVYEVLFGSTDVLSPTTKAEQAGNPPRGIAQAIYGGQWHSTIRKQNRTASTEFAIGYARERFKLINSISSIGYDPVPAIVARYSSHKSFMRMSDGMSLKDFNGSSYVFLVNKSLSEKIRQIDVFANDYIIGKFTRDQFRIGSSNFSFEHPVKFSESDLRDPWVRIRPAGINSCFRFEFSRETPKRFRQPVDLE